MKSARKTRSVWICRTLLQVRREAQDRTLLIEDRLVRDVVARQIRHAIRTLPPKQRAAVIMHKYDETGLCADRTQSWAALPPP